MCNNPSSLRRARLGLEERSVRCYFCGAQCAVAARALTVSCPVCFKQLTTEDVAVRAMHWGGNLRTTGVIVVHRRARVVCREIVASMGVRILGHVEGEVRSGGPVYLGPEAHVKGSVRATGLIVEPGAELSGGLIRVPAGFIRQTAAV